jgi:hypothetical protein
VVPFALLDAHDPGAFSRRPCTVLSKTEQTIVPAHGPTPRLLRLVVARTDWAGVT